MAESIHENAVVDILLRLPAKLLVRCKCVCKQWRSLISEPGFAKSHMQVLKAGDLIPSQRIISGGCYGSLKTVDYEALDSGGEGRMVVVPHVIKPLRESYIVGSCDGLSFCGFGYDSQSDDYKIVAVDVFSDGNWNVAIFSLRSGSWRRIEANLFIYHSTRYSTRYLMEAWITDEYGRGALWTKFFSVDRMANKPLAYTRSGKIIFQMDMKLTLFNPEDNSCKDYPMGSNCDTDYAIYLETFVSPYLRSEPSRIQSL
ncbi:hypothetical protein EUGRSUZ_H02936 [Eucalyptus grandis]|uniref:Uncharacterized protein n=2 Tax=Eucalyptus grandis TaxID=71139 RepID=A0ACC3JT61_EUCGR|nr:hypothetical protein EUGRSUZ_H02936 [Eucalyptus grandis]